LVFSKSGCFEGVGKTGAIQRTAAAAAVAKLLKALMSRGQPLMVEA